MKWLMLGILLLIAFGAFPKAMRMTYGKLVGWKCEQCGKKFHDGWMTEFHHRKPTHSGGKDTYENMECLCVKCHAKAHDRLANTGEGHPKSARLVWHRFRKSKGGHTKKWLKKH